MRKLLLIGVILSFLALGVYDICTGKPKTGIASLLLCAVNIILFF